MVITGGALLRILTANVFALQAKEEHSTMEPNIMAPTR